MISNLTISYPWWFLLLVILVGLSYAGILYLWNTKQKFSTLWQALLFILRFVSISVLAFLLLSPFIKSKKKYIEKPIIVVGIDNSKSVVLGGDSLVYKTQLVNNIHLLSEELSEKYRVDRLLFGSRLTTSDQPDFGDETSDYSKFFSQIKEIYAGMNLGSVILAGDGISNRGIDPEFAASGIPVPIYTIALGDTLLGQDIKVNDVRYNSIVYLDDEFPVEVNISANGFTGKTATIELYAFGRKQGAKQVRISNDQFNQTISFTIKASKVGRQRLRIAVLPHDSEMSKDNNTRNIFINILDNRQKILILANAPHPDISAIKSSLELNKNYEIEIQYARTIKGDLKGFDLVILHQLPSKKQPVQQTINRLKENKIPLFYIAGKQSNFSRFSNQFEGIDLKSTVNSFEESQLAFAPNFTLFSFKREMAQQLEALPPLIVSFGNYKASLNANVFGYQKINRIVTDLPLIVFQENMDSRSGAVLGEGLWIWRMHSYLQYGNTKAFDTFIGKSVQYLMARKDKRFFRVISDGEYRSNDKVLLQAELYNSSYELVNEPDVNLKLTNEEGKQFNFIFSPEGQSYVLDLDHLAVGVYQYSASTNFGGKNYGDVGEFVVSGQSLESRQLNANHGMLFRLAKNSGGEMLYPDEINRLPEILNARNDLKSRIYYEEKYTALHDLLWVVGIILLLLSLEWFLRKYFGSY